ncbi:hypothetical protein KY342_06050 [Candidatus Woesearchaeota archaeon]|nr:hypothetical protein [Candidatus Woesearchaeota archaeon]
MGEQTEIKTREEVAVLQKHLGDRVIINNGHVDVQFQVSSHGIHVRPGGAMIMILKEEARYKHGDVTMHYEGGEREYDALSATDLISSVAEGRPTMYLRFKSEAAPSEVVVASIDSVLNNEKLIKYNGTLPSPKDF